MGKKASLKISLDYDEDDCYDYDYDYDYDYVCNYDGYSHGYAHEYRNSDHKADVRSASPKAASKVSSAEAFRKHKRAYYNNADIKMPDTSSRRAANKGGSSKLKIIAYNMLPEGFESPFVVLTDLGYEDVVLQIVRYLGMRSVSALSCVNRNFDRILSSHFLYTDPNGGSLPCLQGLLLPRISISNHRFLRGLALEAAIFRKSKGPRERNLPMLPILFSHSGGAIMNCKLDQRTGKLSYLTHTCELATTSLSNLSTLKPATTTANTAATAVVSRPTSKLKLKTANSCVDVLTSAMTKDHCAALSMASKGHRRYIVSVIPLTDGGKIWQSDLSISTGYRTSTEYIAPCMKFDSQGEYLVLRLRERMCVYSMTSSALEWEFSIADHERWKAWAMHETYITAICRNKKIKVYDIKTKQMVASGSLPSRMCQFSKEQHKVSMEVFDDRIWIACYPTMLCTGKIFQRLDAVASSATRTDVSGGNSVTKQEMVKHAGCALPVFESLQIKKFVPITSVSTSKPIMKQCGTRLMLADGNILRAFDARDAPAQQHQQQQRWQQNARAQRGLSQESYQWQPSRVLCADATIESFDSDSMKAICCVNAGKKRHIEILRWDEAKVPQLNESILIRNAGTFCDRHDVDRLQLCCNRLVVGYSQCRHGQGCGEVRIFNLTNLQE